MGEEKNKIAQRVHKIKSVWTFAGLGVFSAIEEDTIQEVIKRTEREIIHTSSAFIFISPVYNLFTRVSTPLYLCYL